jgi:hypothetical protein
VGAYVGACVWIMESRHADPRAHQRTGNSYTHAVHYLPSYERTCLHTRDTYIVVIRTCAQFFLHGRKVIGTQRGFLTSEMVLVEWFQKENPSPDRFVGFNSISLQACRVHTKGTSCIYPTSTLLLFP